MPSRGGRPSQHRSPRDPQTRRAPAASADQSGRVGRATPPAHGASGDLPAVDGGYQGPEVEPFPAPAHSTWTYVERADQLALVARRLSTGAVIAIDAEFVQVRVRGPDDPPHRLALIQLAGMPGVGGAFVIDALRLADLSPLEQPLHDARILKLFHGIGADSRVLATRQLVARHTLDLEAVSRSIFGQRESGLQSMLQRACGVRLDKSLQRSDWTRRPLTPAMLGYAARDADMTLVLYQWLLARYPWAVALHEMPADEPPPAVAGWMLPLLDGSRAQRADWAVSNAGLEGRLPEQAAALRAALAVVRRPLTRARIIRLIADLELAELIPVLRPGLSALATEERAGTVRALGRLRDVASEAALRTLLADPVLDVRDAARIALAQLTAPPTQPASSAVTRTHHDGAARWTLNDATNGPPEEAGWQAVLRARFGDRQAPMSAATTEATGDATDDATTPPANDRSTDS